ncbi:pyridoxal-dependent decarboxylase conserved domain protein [Janthinobacterium agaricidamnosum NBRC 102515 = DSM 9628]|uniref:Pyridoxal-dependent decarboxylase conserved domain protein n=1 Tax=Janthinobacterium agaricidamnosum NBRC 102515 = DSM 9628 TaxID=1349767 RepID=W0VE97_9BURK|nr:pyridoxal-dependent decarboxylase conserved domain protein [Janthinobacterium agaricidamnosum NBRC 102515 = DSM 9628]
MMPLVASSAEATTLLRAAEKFIADYIDAIPSSPAYDVDTVDAFMRDPAARALPDEQGRSLSELLEIVGRAGRLGASSVNGKTLAYIPGSSLVTAAIADLLSGVLNNYTGVNFAAPAMVALERDVLRWLGDLMGMPAGSSGILTSGGSLAALSALLCARTERLQGDISGATMYMTEQAHHSIPKAARILGFGPDAIRMVPVDSAYRMDIAALRVAVQQDRQAGRRPFCLVITAGTTNSGVIDSLQELGEFAREQGLWLHVDAAYGGFFRLTERGRSRFAGIEQADSIVLDPHKGLFLPFGTGCLLVRDGNILKRAHSGEEAAYLRDLDDQHVDDFADLSPELTRPNRGLKMWLPLHLHGVAAFRRALDEKLDLAGHAFERLTRMPGIAVGAQPVLSIVTFNCSSAAATLDADNQLTDRLVQQINSAGQVFLSTTLLGARVVARLAVLNLRTGMPEVERALGQIEKYTALMLRDRELAEVSSASITTQAAL